MPNILGQTNSVADCGLIAACSSASLSGTLSAELIDGAATGSNELTLSINASGLASPLGFQTIANEPNITDWAAGDWVVRLNVTSANMNMEWEGTHVCKVSASPTCGSAVTVGSLTSQTISMFPTGVKTMTVSGSNITVGATDVVYIVIILRNTDTMMTQSCGVTVDQDIDTPLVDVVAVQPVIPMLRVRTEWDTAPEPIDSFPRFFPLILPPPPPPPPANPVIPFITVPMRREQVPDLDASLPFFFPTFVREPSFPVPPFQVVPFHFDIERPQEAFPQFLPTFVREPSFPVLPFNVVPFHFDEPKLHESLPQYFRQPIFTTFARPVIPIQTVPMYRHEVEPIDSPPKYIDFPIFSAAPPAPANPVPPIQVVPFVFQRPELDGAIPFFFETFVREPSFPVPPFQVVPFHFPRPELDGAIPFFFETFVREPSFPVPPFQMVPFHFDIAKPEESFPKYTYFPFRSVAPPAPANAVIPFFKGQWLGDRAPELDGAIPQYIYYPFFTTFARPVPPFQVVPFHFEEPPLDGAIPKFYLLILPSEGLGISRPRVIQMQTILDETDPEIADHPYMKPRFLPTVMFFTDWQDYEEFYQYDDTKYGGSQAVFFEANLIDTATGPVRARLFNITDNVPIPGSTVQTTSSTAVRLRSVDLASVLSGAKEYKGQIGLKRGQTGDMGPARLVVEQ